ncbi:hypothetical protein R5W23_004041 [Gemmata sp. JC673]|uniref:DUF4178 domain-containing protein n=1 Tax=Gemmata algarum TaxID=2975278 RepID=A0ABU5F772_9BACT|nr:hypothetical protein [Gemmata algarum]MDY3562575.1 hypothetical protein [Gemmata algarum]
MSESTPEMFAAGPIGCWSTAEVLPYGEAVYFYPKGIGIHFDYSGLSCQETYFEWETASDSCIRIRWPESFWGCEGEEDEEPTGEGWELGSYSVAKGVTPYGGVRRHLRTMSGALLGLDELWYQGPLPDRPASDWPLRDRTYVGHEPESTWMRTLGCLVGLYLAIASSAFLGLQALFGHR